MGDLEDIAERCEAHGPQPGQMDLAAWAAQAHRDRIALLEMVRAAQHIASSVETLERVRDRVFQEWKAADVACAEARDEAKARNSNTITARERTADSYKDGVSDALGAIDSMLTEARAAQQEVACTAQQHREKSRVESACDAASGGTTGSRLGQTTRLADSSPSKTPGSESASTAGSSATYATSEARAAQPAPVFQVGDRVRLKRDVVRDGNGEYLSIPREDVDRLVSELSTIETFGPADGKIGVTLVLSNGREWRVYTDDIEPASAATDHAELLRHADRFSGNLDARNMTGALVRNLAAALRAEVERRRQADVLLNNATTLADREGEAKHAYHKRAEAAEAKLRDVEAALEDAVHYTEQELSEPDLAIVPLAMKVAQQCREARAALEAERKAHAVTKADRDQAVEVERHCKQLRAEAEAKLEAERKAHEAMRQKEDGALAEAEREVEQLRAKLSALTAPIVLDEAFAEECADIYEEAFSSFDSPSVSAARNHAVREVARHVLQRMRARLVSDETRWAFSRASVFTAPDHWEAGMRAALDHAIGSLGQADAAADEDQCPVDDATLGRWSAGGVLSAEERMGKGLHVSGTACVHDVNELAIAVSHLVDEVRRLRKLEGAK